MRPDEIVILLTLLQALTAFAMAAITAAIGGERLRMSRRLLAWSFGLLGLFFVLSIVSFSLAGQGPRWTLTRTAASWAGQATALMHLGLLLMALYVTALQRPLRARSVAWIAAGAAAGAAASALPGALESTGAQLRVLLRVGLRALLFASAYGAIAILLARYRSARGRSLGQWLVVAAFAVLALVHVGYFASATGVPSRSGLGGTLAWLQLGGLVGLLMLSIALLVWLHERTTAEAEQRTFEADRMAHYDAETQMPNRAGLLRGLPGEGRADAPLAVMVVKLQRFALLERTLGTPWVARALRELATAMAAGRGFHLVAIGRIDSDRLGAFLSADGTLADAEVLSRRRAVEQAVLGLDHPVSLSFGYAVRHLRETPGTLLASACVAQEKAESAGVRMLRFEAEQVASDAEEVQLVGALYRAIGEDQLALDLQGIYRSGDGQLDSVEALLRWNHPTEGRLAPGRFLPAAERGGLMVDIDRWVLDRACRCLATRESAGEAPVPLCINLSSASLLDAGLPGVVKAQLTRYRVPPDRLEVEITESAAMGDLGLAASVVEQLQKIGVRVALDDLGTGYSSLVHLRELRADRLKIDRSFVRAEDPFGRAIAAAIAALGRSLGRDVVAEGVETGDDLAFCRGQGIGLVQGWYLHRPARDWPPSRAGVETPPT